MLTLNSSSRPIFEGTLGGDPWVLTHGLSQTLRVPLSGYSLEMALLHHFGPARGFRVPAMRFNSPGCHASCFLPVPFPHHTAVAPAVPAAELGVVGVLRACAGIEGYLFSHHASTPR